MGLFNPVTSIIIFFPLSVDDFLRFMFALGKPTSRMLKVDSLHYTGDGISEMYSISPFQFLLFQFQVVFS